MGWVTTVAIAVVLAAVSVVVVVDNAASFEIWFGGNIELCDSKL